MAPPNPEHELARLRKTLHANVPPVVLILGPAGFFRGEALDAVMAALPEQADVRSLDGSRETDGAELQDLCSVSLFGGGRWVVVRRAEGWLAQHGAALAAVLPRMAAGCGLVLEAVKLDRRTKVGKKLAGASAVFEFRALYDRPYDRSRSPLEGELVGWIAGRAKVRGLRLSGEAALLLMTTVGLDPAELVAELDRLAAREELRGRALGPADLEGALSVGFESTQFELAEALLDGDRRLATRSLEALLARGLRGRDGQVLDRAGLFPMVASWLYKSLAQAYEGRFLLDRGVALQDVPGRVGVRAFVPRFSAHVAKNREPRLRRGLQLLHEAQRELRLSGEDPAWILRRFVDRYFAGSAS